MFSRIDWYDLAERSGWTAVQTFVVTIAAAGADYVNVASWKAAALAAGAAGISALKNAIVHINSGGDTPAP